MAKDMFGNVVTHDIYGNPLKKEGELKRKTYTADFYDLMDKQNKLCADPQCSKRHGRRLSVSTIRDLDHIFPIKLWELMKKKGNPNDISNLQLLCPNCHRIKTASDKKKIAEYKRKKGKRTQPLDMFGNPIPKQQKVKFGF